MKIVSDKYRAIDEKMVVAEIASLLAQSGIRTEVRHTELTGTRVMSEILLPDLGSSEFGGITPSIKAFNSHDGTSAFRVAIGVNRLVCSNGMTITETQFSERIIHRKGSTLEEALEALPEVIRKAIHYIQFNLLPFFDQLQDTPVTPAQMLFIIEELRIPKKVKKRAAEAVVNQRIRPTYDQDNSLFSLYNFVNQFVREAPRSTPNSRERVEQRLLSDIVSLAKVA